MFVFLIENMCERNPSVKKRLWINVAEKGMYHEVVLYDNSPVVPDATVVNLFNPLKRSGGVELLIVQQIIERFNGKISVSNMPVGNRSMRTEFRIQFPKLNTKKMRSLAINN